MKTILYITSVATCMSGCGTYEKYQRPEVSVSGLYGEDMQLSDSSSSIANVSWREFFKDDILQSLIDTALAENTDLRIASLEVTEAEASLLASRMAYLPSLSFSPQGNISSYDGSKAAKTYNLALSAEWEIDFAGRLTECRHPVATSFPSPRRATGRAHPAGNVL